ncbi:hypothetical protein GCM10008935_02630 [Alkalibacillus silvisoli]|uniref:Mas-related G-protein coupled receptor member D n=1 Tax=Alkalibacillus silvisoli TaxID=392823 RepID=A0ABN0ZL26_9BACI
MDPMIVFIILYFFGALFLFYLVVCLTIDVIKSPKHIYSWFILCGLIGALYLLITVNIW